jgi:hypothetical protein
VTEWHGIVSPARIGEGACVSNWFSCACVA